MRVVVVDDHATVSELMCRAFDDIEDLDCVGTAATAKAAGALVEQERPDVVLMDVQLGDDDGVALTADLVRRYEGLRVVILTGRTDADLAQRAAAAGACGLLPKNGSLDDVLTAIRTARFGGLSVHPQLLVTLLGAPQAPEPPPLTNRELVVLRELANGSSVRQISEQLFLSEHTVRGYVKRLLMKLDAHSQLEAVAVGKRLGLVG